MGEAGRSIGLEARLHRLETIVAALEREDLELEEALGLFEEGIGHLRAAQELIRRTELKIERLLDDGGREQVLDEPAVDATDRAED
ncbi:MAG TPA: exodeoxyribonuclease VII small subunit [Longimicrobiales bacterium]